jgi:hypothetical protein
MFDIRFSLDLAVTLKDGLVAMKQPAVNCFYQVCQSWLPANPCSFSLLRVAVAELLVFRVVLLLLFGFLQFSCHFLF